MNLSVYNLKTTRSINIRMNNEKSVVSQICQESLTRKSENKNVTTIGSFDESQFQYCKFVELKLNLMNQNN